VSADHRRPVLLYLPGLDGTGRLLHRQPRLHDAFRVLPNPYPQLEPRTYDQLADEAADRLTAALAPGGRATVLAESFGGAVALTLALRHPRLVERLCLINTFAWFPRRRLIAFGAWLLGNAPPRPAPARGRFLRELVLMNPRIRARERADWWKLTGDVPMCGFAYRARLIRELDLRPRLKEVTVPALVVIDPADRLVPARAGRELARGLPRARAVYASIGHAGLIHPRFDVCRLLSQTKFWPA
jgi:pimeloyl-ACP methyl ester carboxylesterase